MYHHQLVLVPLKHKIRMLRNFTSSTHGDVYSLFTRYQTLSCILYMLELTYTSEELEGATVIIPI